MTDRVLSFVGLGKYGTCTYAWADRPEHHVTTNMFPLAMSAWFPSAPVNVFVTTEAEKDKGRALQAGSKEVALVRVPSGRTAAELWEMFNVIVNTVEDGESIALDVTHGFRTQPMLMLAAAVYLRSTKNVTITEVLYGAYDARDQETNTAPVFSLRPFLDLIDWSTAFEQWDRFGSLGAFVDVVARGDARHPDARLSKTMRNVADGLALNRVEHTRRSAKSAIESARLRAEELRRNGAPSDIPTAALLERFVERLEPLAAPPEGRTPAALAAHAASYAEMIEVLLAQGQLAQAAAVARESLVSLVLLAREPGADLAEPAGRARWESALNSCADDKAGPPELAPISAAWSWIREVRNDLAHAGYTRTNLKTPKIRTNTHDACQRIVNLLKQPPLDAIDLLEPQPQRSQEANYA